MKTSRTLGGVLVLCLALLALTGCDAQEPAAAPTHTVTVTVTPSPSDSSHITANPEESATVPAATPSGGAKGEQRAQPSESASWPDDHAPNSDDLYVPNPTPTPLAGVPAMSIDMSLVQAEGMEDGNFVIYLKVPKTQGAPSEAAAALGDARADSLRDTPYAEELGNVVVYTLDGEPLYQTPLSGGSGR